MLLSGWFEGCGLVHFRLGKFWLGFATHALLYNSPGFTPLGLSLHLFSGFQLSQIQRSGWAGIVEIVNCENEQLAVIVTIHGFNVESGGAPPPYK